MDLKLAGSNPFGVLRLDPFTSKGLIKRSLKSGQFEGSLGELQKIVVDHLRPTAEAVTKRLEACILANRHYSEQHIG